MDNLRKNNKMGGRPEVPGRESPSQFYQHQKPFSPRNHRYKKALIPGGQQKEVAGKTKTNKALWTVGGRVEGQIVAEEEGGVQGGKG